MSDGQSESEQKPQVPPTGYETVHMPPIKPGERGVQTKREHHGQIVESALEKGYQGGQDEPDAAQEEGRRSRIGGPQPSEVKEAEDWLASIKKQAEQAKETSGVLKGQEGNEDN